MVNKLQGHRPDGKTRKGEPGHYAPDALRGSGQSRERRLLKAAPTILSFLEVLGDTLQPRLYHATIDHTGGNCWDPRVTLGLARALRAALRISTRRGWPAMANVETARKGLLHAHILVSAGVPLPEVIEIPDQEGIVLVRFELQPPLEHERTQMAPAEWINYLHKAPHADAIDFNRAYPPTDPRQPSSFRTVLQAYNDAKARAHALGLRRLPPRLLKFYIPQLTPQQRTELIRALEAAANTRATAAAVHRITELEWELTDIRAIFGKRKAKTDLAWKRLLVTVNVILQHEAGGQPLRHLLAKTTPVIRRANYYKVLKQYAAEIRQAQCVIAARRQPPQTGVDRLRTRLQGAPKK